MHFNPRNRYLAIEVLENGAKEPEATPILLPDDYKPVEKEYALAKIIDWAPDCNGQFWEDDIIIVRQNMIEEIEIDDETHYFVLENHVLGVSIENEEGEPFISGETDIN